MHQNYQDVLPLLDRFVAEYLSDRTSFILNPLHLFPSTSLLRSAYPSALPRHIITRIPPPPPLSPPPLDTQPQESKESPATTQEKHEEKTADSVEAMANALAKMDPRNLKWMWSGLTFGKGSSPKPTIPSTPAAIVPHVAEAAPQSDEGSTGHAGREAEVEIDTESLQEAIASDNVHISSARSSPEGPSPAPALQHLSEDKPQLAEKEERPFEGSVAEPEETSAEHHPSTSELTVTQDHSDIADVTPTLGLQDSDESSQPLLTFLSTSVFLAELDAPQQTARRKVFHATVGSSSKLMFSRLNHALERG